MYSIAFSSNKTPVERIIDTPTQTPCAKSCEVAYVASKCIMLWGATNWSRANAHCREVL